MTVEIVSGLKGKERGHAHRHRPQRLVADVEVVMREAAALPSQDAVVGIVGGKAGNRGAEGLALLHAFQNEVHPMLPGPFHAAQGGTNIILLAYLRLGPFEGGVVARKRLHPCLILVGSPRQHFLGDHRLANHVLKEIRHLTRPRQTAQITVDHHTVKTVVYKKKQAAKQLGERLHRSSSSGLVMTTRSSNGRPVEANFKYVCLVLGSESQLSRRFCRAPSCAFRRPIPISNCGCATCRLLRKLPLSSTERWTLGFSVCRLRMRNCKAFLCFVNGWSW